MPNFEKQIWVSCRVSYVFVEILAKDRPEDDNQTDTSHWEGISIGSTLSTNNCSSGSDTHEGESSIATGDLTSLDFHPSITCIASMVKWAWIQSDFVFNCLVRHVQPYFFLQSSERQWGIGISAGFFTSTFT